MAIGNIEQGKNPTEVKRKLESGVAMWELNTEEQKSGRTLPGIPDEKKSSRLLKVARRSKDSSDSESFEPLEMEPKIKFSVEDESSVMTSGEESYESEQVSLTELTGIVMRIH